MNGNLSEMLVGTIPESIGMLENLVVFYMSHQGIYGTIPEALTALPSIRLITLSSNALSYVIVRS
jgi:hypothetical protein